MARWDTCSRCEKKYGRGIHWKGTLCPRCAKLMENIRRSVRRYLTEPLQVIKQEEQDGN